MPSLIPGFEYDIFISYRQNDNRSGWVTDFVKALQEELAATIKEPISVYFDANPHDGLLDTHSVDKSLEGKLKCLIFIPVLSQTYCDLKSFAWQQEFCAFNSLAKADPYGRDIKLGSGNVASRILPVKIHDLDAEDKQALEKEMGAVLRAVEFTYKEPGVNRPLLANEENPAKNLNQLVYRNQVNKVANGVKEMVTALKSPASNQTNVAIPNPVSDWKMHFSARKMTYAALGLTILFALIYGISQFTTSPAGEPTSVGKSIAVLPFADMSQNHDQEFFGDGVAEEIINVLVKVPDLKVIARTSSFQFKGKNEDLRNIGTTLGVSTILEGSIRKSNDNIRITAQLIRASDGSHLWSKTYDRDASDVFKVQDEIAQEVVDALKITLAATLKSSIPATRNEEAYQAYLQGMFFLDQASAPGNAKAMEFFDRSIQLDSGFAPAWGSRAILLYRMYRPVDAAWKDAKAAARKAMSLDPELSLPHVTLGNIAMSEYDWQLGEAEIRKGYALDSRNAVCLRNYGRMLYIFGDHEGGLEFVRKSVAVDPVSANSYNYLGKLSYLEGRLEEALTAYDKAEALSPLSSSTSGGLDQSLIILALKGPQALLERQSIESIPAIKLAAKSMAEFALKQFEESAKDLAELIEGYGERNAYSIAILYALRNDHEHSMQWLERADRQKDRALLFVSDEPSFKPFHKQARFIALMKKMNLTEIH